MQLTLTHFAQSYREVNIAHSRVLIPQVYRVWSNGIDSLYLHSPNLCSLFYPRMPFWSKWPPSSKIDFSRELDQRTAGKISRKSKSQGVHASAIQQVREHLLKTISHLLLPLCSKWNGFFFFFSVLLGCIHQPMLLRLSSLKLRIWSVTAIREYNSNKQILLSPWLPNSTFIPWIPIIIPGAVFLTCERSKRSTMENENRNIAIGDMQNSPLRLTCYKEIFICLRDVFWWSYKYSIQCKHIYQE